MFEEEISPEELFRQFFGGGMGGGFGESIFHTHFTLPFKHDCLAVQILIWTISVGGGGLFDSSPGFVFNLGGGPGVRVHQFGGNRPRRRPPGAGPGANDTQNAHQPPTAASAIYNLLPLLIFFILPLLSSLFSGSGSSAPKVPSFSIDVPAPPLLTQQHISSRLKVPYFVNPTDVAGFTSRKWGDLDRAAENTLVYRLNSECESEQVERQRLLQEAQGWFSVDTDKLDEAERLEMRSCHRLRNFQSWR